MEACSATGSEDTQDLFEGPGDLSIAVHITPYGDAAVHRAWLEGATRRRLLVNCFDGLGAAADGAFSIAVDQIDG